MPNRSRSPIRRGVLAAEMAILLPTLGLFAVIVIDFSRAYYFYLTITNCALNGAMYASGAVNPNIYFDPSAQTQTHYATSDAITTNANLDAANLNNNLTVSVSAVGSDSYGKYVDVTASYPFTTIVDFVGLTPPITMQRTIRTRIVEK